MLSFKQGKSVSLEIATKGNANYRISKQKGSMEYGVLLKIVLISLDLNIKKSFVPAAAAGCS